ncbi:SPFH domain-containing protein [Bacillus alkalicellulosilyticus]|uniref:SPFH domain-containing protein n=1 Tax=Alkalihalobacterium alkalicellulosilyticum TaxID=1912214 RepID=UPI00099649B2|nr:SPFH domain-containing protein [Bacillus alkalicellulosilyticus]
MSFFRGQLANVVEWEEFRDDMIFWKWDNREVKKGSKLILQSGQDAIFINSGKIEGIFTEAGDYNIESEIIPFLSTLKGFRFGFNSGMRVEVLFVNTKTFIVKWGTRNAINIPSPALPGGIPIRANGTFSFKVKDYIALIDNVAGIKKSYVVNDVKLRITSILDGLLMKWITREGKDMFNLQANSLEISRGIKEDLDMEIMKNGLNITDFTINSFTYPKEIQDMITEVASQGMIGNLNKYKDVVLTDALAESMKTGKGNHAGGTASEMANLVMGVNVGSHMVQNMNLNPQQQQQQMNQYNNPQQGYYQPNQGQQHPNQGQHQQPPQYVAPPQQEQVQQPTPPPPSNEQKPNFCPNCGTKTGGTNFCGNCGHKLVP